jgi:hypothetical protein
LIKGFNSLHEAHEEESRGHEDGYQRSGLGHPGLWPPVALGRTGFVFFVEIVVRLKLADNQVK